MTTCTRCVYDDSIPGIMFDDDGVCSYCHIHDRMDAMYPTGETGMAILRNLAGEMRRNRKGKYDCIVGYSGGCDSSYTLFIAKRVLKLEPLAVHYDNGWNTDVAEQNMANGVKRLGVDFYRYRVADKEVRSLARAFLLSGALDFEAPTDIGLTACLYRAAETHGVKYILGGHSFRTEGIAPLGWSYMDGKYIASVHEQYGDGVDLRTYPNLWLKDFLRWSVGGIRRIRPLYYVDYIKAAVKRQLLEEMDWQWYGGHHLESQITDFFATYLMPRRTGIDFRKLGWAALVRSGQLDRGVALERISQPMHTPEPVMHEIRQRLGVNMAEVAALPVRTYREFPNYKRTFERLRPLFWALVKANRVPLSFYTKYCLPERG